MANKTSKQRGSGGRVTPKSSVTKTAAKSAGKPGASGHETAPTSRRYTPPDRTIHQPSPIWVPIVMFTLLGLGMVLIIVNYAGVFGAAQNWRLVVGLVLILAGILTATQYR